MPDGTAATPSAKPAASEARRLRFAEIERSALNPRKRFDDAAIVQLADSIHKLGLLQNMTVRPHPKLAGKFELIAGEQRHRAIEKLIADKRVAADAAWPVSVVVLDDKDALTVALTENVARNELTPWEEADAFKRLVGMKMLPREIGARIGKTERFVQLRLRLLDKLAPKALDALRDGKISLEHARELLKGPVPRQLEVLKSIHPLDAKDPPNRWGLIVTASQVRDAMREKMREFGEALFDPATYKGEIVTDEDTGEKFFADQGEFDRKQTQAIEAKVAELKARHGKAEFSENSNGKDMPWNMMAASKAQIDSGKAVCVVWIDESGKAWKFAHALCVPKYDDKPLRDANGLAGGGRVAEKTAQKPEDIPVGAARHALTIRTHALQEAIAEDGKAGAGHAKRVVVLGLLGQTDIARIAYRSVKLGVGPADPAPAVAAILAAFAKRGLKRAPEHTRTASKWKEVAALSAGDLDKLFAALVASCVSVEDQYARDCWPEEDELALAATLKADPAASFKLDGEFLGRLKKGQLLRIVTDLERNDDPRFVRGSDALTAGVLRKIILETPAARAKGYVPPWCRFRPPAETKAALRATRAIVGVTLKPKTAPAANPPKPPKAAKAGAKSKPKAKAK